MITTSYKVHRGLKQRAAKQLLLIILTISSLSACDKQTTATTNSPGTNTQPNNSPTGVTTDLAPIGNIELWPQITSAVTKNSETESRISALLATMTLEQKVAQMIQPEIRDVSLDDMRRYGFGSYLNGGGAFPYNNKHATAQQWIKLAEDMYQASIDDSLDGSTIPTMWGTDAVHGHNNVIGATLFPHNIGLGATRNPELIERIAAATAKEVMATGIDWVFAPTVAVVRDDRWGRTYEGYSEDPSITFAYSKAIVEGLQGRADQDFLGDQRVIATIKHFVGDGGTVNGNDQGDNLASEQDLVNIHAQGYVSGLAAGAQTVMASFNSLHGKKMHGYRYMLTDVLKQRMGFDGLIVGDWNGHGQVKGCSNSSCPQAVNAGMDILMAPTATWKPLYHNTIEQVRSGEISEARINDAVTRILRVKIRAGLFDKASPKNRPLAGKIALIGAAEHREIAKQAVRESLVLLKNKNNLLPLPAKQHVFITGDGADNIGKQAGGWSITWQGTNNTNADFPGGTSIYAGIHRAVSAAGGTTELGDMQINGGANYSTKPDVAIVVFGENPYAEGNGDIDDLEYQRGNKTDLKLLRTLQAKGIPVVSIFISGRPLWVNAELNASDAFVAAWLPGSEGSAVADVIMQDGNGNIQYNFKGKLPYSWPRDPEQFVLNKSDDNYDPLFPINFGMRYGDTNTLTDMLNEASSRRNQIDVSRLALFAQGKQEPWLIGVNHNKHTKVMVSNITHHGALSVRTTDRNIQEDALQLVWSGEADTVFRIFSEQIQDLQRYQKSNAVLSVHVRRTALANKPVYLSMDCGSQCVGSVDISNFVSALSQNEWKRLAVDLNCFAKAGANLSQIHTAFALHTTGQLGLTISDIAIEPYSASSADINCPVN